MQRCKNVSLVVLFASSYTMDMMGERNNWREGLKITGAILYLIH